jgi:hypothetical protein
MATQQQDPQQTTNGNNLVKVTFFLAIDWRFVNVIVSVLRLAYDYLAADGQPSLCGS